MHKISANSCFNFIERMSNNKAITQNAAQKLKYAIAIACEMRLRVYMQENSQCENVIDLNQDGIEKFLNNVVIANTVNYQRWSRGHKARGQGQGHKKNPRPRPRTSFPRIEPLEAKDRNARGQDQGHRRKRSPKQKIKVSKNFFQAIFNSLAYPGFFDWGGLNHKSHEMTSSKFFQRESACGTKLS